jgi:hypothetical protein
MWDRDICRYCTVILGADQKMERRAGNVRLCRTDLDTAAERGRLQMNCLIYRNKLCHPRRCRLANPQGCDTVSEYLFDLHRLTTA